MISGLGVGVSRDDRDEFGVVYNSFSCFVMLVSELLLLIIFNDACFLQRMILLAVLLNCFFDVTLCLV